MGEFSAVEERSASPKRWIASFEFDEYVRSFKSASDRTRRIFYVIATTTILIAVSTWNLRPDSWQQAHIAAWTQAPKNAEPRVERVTEMREQYAKAFVDRMVIVDIPAVGISMDANDFGIFGGIGLTFLMLLLWVSLAREHENLCLSLFKVGEICRREEQYDERDSEANLLYHALAMGQTMNHPPTLARWRRPLGWINLLAVAALFLAPAAVQGWVYRSNVQSLAEIQKQLKGKTFSIPDALLPLQQSLFAALLILAVVCWVYVRASDVRWKRTFFAINKGHALRPQHPWYRWLRLPWPAHPIVRARLALDLLFGKKGAPANGESVAKFETAKPVNGESATLGEKLTMCRRLFEGSLDVVLQKTPELRYVPLTSIRVIDSKIADKKWTVSVAVRYRPVALGGFIASLFGRARTGAT